MQRLPVGTSVVTRPATAGSPHHPPVMGGGITTNATTHYLPRIAHFLSGKGSLGEQINAINILNKYTADPDHEQLASSIPEILENLADALDGHNVMGRVLQDRIDKDKRKAKQENLSESDMQVRIVNGWWLNDCMGSSSSSSSMVAGLW